MARGKAVAKKKTKKNVAEGVAHINATFNNTHITFSDKAGNVLSWTTSGSNGFRGSRKSTPYAAQVSAESLTRDAMSTFGLKVLDIRVKGPGNGRESALRGIAAAGIEVRSIMDITPIPHNGCRPKKRRRV